MRTLAEKSGKVMYPKSLSMRNYRARGRRSKKKGKLITAGEGGGSSICFRDARARRAARKGVVKGSRRRTFAVGAAKNAERK